MKKSILRIFAIVAFVFSFSAVLAACFDGKLLGIEVVENSYQTTYQQFEQVSFANMQIVATYESGKTKTVTYPNFTIGSVNTLTLTAGDKTITIAYQGKTTTITITVIAVDVSNEEVVGYESPAFITAYHGNVATQQNKETEFKVRDKGYVVGNNNPFYMVPKITVLDLDTNLTYISTNYESNITISALTGENFVALNENEVASVVTIDYEDYALHFTNAAVGNTYKIEMSIVVTAQVDPSLADEKVELTVNIIDGWNAYTTADLSRWDNTSADWNEYKAANQIGNEEISALVLHSDLTITNADLPQSYFHKVGDSDVNSAHYDYAYIVANNGSLKDQINVYKRTLQANQSFAFYGNNFTIDASAVSLITRDNGNAPSSSEDYVVPNTGLFDFSTQISNSAPVAGTRATLQDVNLIGNASRSAEESNTARIGGLILLDSWNSKDLTIDNVIAKSWITTFRITNLHESATISNTRSYDSYSVSVYLWDVGNNTQIVSSEFKRAGGPLFMLTDANPSDEGYSNLNIDSETVLENFVTGQEPWFSINGATSIVSSFVALNNLIVGYSMQFQMPKTYVNAEGMVNFISATIPGDALTDEGNVYGKFQYNNFVNDMKDTDLQTYFSSPYGAAGVPIFQAGGVEVLFNGDNQNPQLLKLVDGTPTVIGQEDAGLFTGDFINLFVKASAYLGVTLGYFDYIPA